MIKVFLGGTCNESQWRELLKPFLDIGFFDPVVKDWTPECMREELIQRESCEFCLYVITPKMTGVYAIAEVIDDSNKRPGKTIFCILNHDGGEEFSEGQLRSLGQVAQMVKDNGGAVFDSLTAVARYLNQQSTV